MSPAARGVSTALAALVAAGCTGPSSVLDTAGADAAETARLFWWMTASGAVIWVAVVAVAIYSLIAPPPANARRLSMWLIVGGGAVLPSILLLALLSYGLRPLGRVHTPSPASLVIDVAGEQWWWRLRYRAPSGVTVDTANEMRLPAGERIHLRLSSDNVIHAFWIPSIAGKVDLIPGRTTHLSLAPTRTGVFRGVCAEYCGTSHAFMALDVEVMTRPAFDRWLAAESTAARAPATTPERSGQERFLANGCGACHAIRGTAAAGVIGPDLTHVGGRRTLGAGALPNDTEAFARWIANPGGIKPHARMPAFGTVAADDDIDAMAIYLDSLR